MIRLTLCVPWPKCKFYIRKMHPLANMVIKSCFLSQALWMEFCHNFKIRNSRVHTRTETHLFKDRQTQMLHHANFKTYVAGLKIFQKYPVLKVIEYDQSIRMYKKGYPIMAFAKISLLSSVIYLFKSYTCTVAGTWSTLNQYWLLTFQRKPC